MKLSIDSINNLKTKISLDDQEFVKEYLSPRDQDVLGAIMDALKQQDKNLSDITSVEVNQGPGSFTGIRVGISIAQVISFTLKIPINSKPPGSLIDPEYGGDASITINSNKIPSIDILKT